MKLDRNYHGSFISLIFQTVLFCDKYRKVVNFSFSFDSFWEEKAVAKLLSNIT